MRVELPSSVRGSGPLSSSLVRGVREGERGERADDFGERGEVRSVMRHRRKPKYRVDVLAEGAHQTWLCFNSLSLAWHDASTMAAACL